MSRSLTIQVLMALGFAAVFAGCGSLTQTKESIPVSTGFLSPDDDLGRPVALAGPAKRVVIVGPGAVETLYAMGAGASLVGRDQISTYPKATAKVPVVGDFTGPFTEKVAALRPDLVIVQGETWTASAMDNWQRQCGAQTATLNAPTILGSAADMEKLGAWTGHAVEAKRLADTLRAAAKPGNPKLHIFIEVGRSPLWTVGKNALVGEVVGRAFLNSADVDFGLSGYRPFNIENLYAHEPDAYLVTTKDSKAKVLRDLRVQPRLSELKCVQKGDVVVIDDDLVLRAGPRLVEGIARLKAEAARLGAERHF